MINHPNRASKNEAKLWELRWLTNFPCTPEGGVRGPETRTEKFAATYGQAIARWKAERAKASSWTQVTLYGSGPRVREGLGTAGG